jgi:hypothetical protein
MTTTTGAEAHRDAATVAATSRRAQGLPTLVACLDTYAALVAMTAVHEQTPTAPVRAAHRSGFGTSCPPTSDEGSRDEPPTYTYGAADERSQA